MNEDLEKSLSIAWDGFKGVKWQRNIDVANFIEMNYEEYTGDESFLVGKSSKTAKVWKKCESLLKKEAISGVLDVETDIIAGIDNFEPGYIDRKNEVIVGEEDKLYKKELVVNDINLLLFDKINNWLEVDVKTRYSSKFAKAKIKQKDNNTIEVIFEEAQRAITPGQSAVFYLDDIVVGGGKIV